MPEQTFSGIDAGRGFDWGRTSQDYDRYRPGPPESFYQRLTGFGIGAADQRLLDLGTGTGLLARRFAAMGIRVCGVDVSEAQIAMAQSAAAREKAQINFTVAGAEALPFADESQDVITANQCWMYFDLARTIPEVRRVLVSGGALVVSHFSFLPTLDPVVAASEALVLKHNPDWGGAAWNGYLPAEPKWSRSAFDLTGFFTYDEAITFSRESWRGRMRALRGIAASLTPAQVAAFDEEHAQMLAGMVDQQFSILHRIHAQIFTPKAR